MAGATRVCTCRCYPTPTHGRWSRCMFAQRQSLFREKEVMKTKLFAGAISMSLVCALGAACTVDNANAPVTRGHAGGAGGGTAGTQQGVDGAAGSGITAASTGGSNNGGMNAGGASGALGTGGAAGTGEIEAGLAGASGAGPAVICDPAT